MSIADQIKEQYEFSKTMKPQKITDLVDFLVEAMADIAEDVADLQGRVSTLESGTTTTTEQ